jgi:hypothetical protein
MSVGFAGKEDKVDLGGLRTRLHKMSDQELLRFGLASKSICSPDASFGKPPQESFVIQLREARKEWNRRNPELPLRDSI